MSGYDAIRDVGNTLIKLLREQMCPEPISKPETICLCSSGDVLKYPDVQLALVLYSIAEVPHFRNQEKLPVGSSELKYPPLTLDLSYIMTAYAQPSATLAALEEHTILGRAMQVFYDTPILKGSVLQGVLAERNDELRIELNPLSLDELTKIWGAFTNMNYKPLVSYKVMSVAIDSTLSLKTRRADSITI